MIVYRHVYMFGHHLPKSLELGRVEWSPERWTGVYRVTYKCISILGLIVWRKPIAKELLY